MAGLPAVVLPGRWPLGLGMPMPGRKVRCPMTKAAGALHVVRCKGSHSVNLPLNSFLPWGPRRKGQGARFRAPAISASLRSTCPPKSQRPLGRAGRNHDCCCQGRRKHQEPQKRRGQRPGGKPLRAHQSNLQLGSRKVSGRMKFNGTSVVFMIEATASRP